MPRYLQRLVDQVRHPACNPTRFRPAQLFVRSTVGSLVFFVLILLFPSWWWIPAAVIVGSATVIHPLCWITGKKHAPGGHWFHFER